jgi:hypothetical protein
MFEILLLIQLMSLESFLSKTGWFENCQDYNNSKQFVRKKWVQCKPYCDKFSVLTYLISFQGSLCRVHFTQPETLNVLWPVWLNNNLIFAVFDFYGVMGFLTLILWILDYICERKCRRIDIGFYSFILYPGICQIFWMFHARLGKFSMHCKIVFLMILKEHYYPCSFFHSWLSSLLF